MESRINTIAILGVVMVTKTIFLDIDGVMHADNAARSFEIYGRLQFTGDSIFIWMPILAQLVHKKPVQIVVHSSWRHHYSLEELQQFFPPDIRYQVTGKTEGVGRIDSIRAYLSDHPEIEDYLALDDINNDFPKDWPHLVLVDGQTGISDPRVQQKVSAFIG